jgi:hypothetical protein
VHFSGVDRRLQPNVNRSPRQPAATREALAAVWRRAGGLVGRFHSSVVILTEPGPFSCFRHPRFLALLQADARSIIEG